MKRVAYRTRAPLGQEKVILELLATRGAGIDAVVQVGTNMRVLDFVEQLEPLIEVPILGINPVLYWCALREPGIDDSVAGAGRLFREFQGPAYRRTLFHL